MSTSRNVRSFALEHRVDRVARRARDLGDDRALLADELVVERRLADVRPAEDRDADRVVLDRSRRFARQPVEHLVEQVAGVRAVQAGDRERLAEAEPVELEREALLRRVVDLVREHEHVLLRLAQDLRELLVARRDPGAGIDDEQHEVGLGDRGARLLGDLLRDRARVGDVDAAGVDQQEAAPVPLADELLAVARRALRLVHDGLARRGEPVDERRLADVREADDRDRALQLDRRAAHTGGVACARAAPGMDVGEPVEEHVDAALDLGGRLLVAAAALRQAVEAHRLAEGDRARREVAELPELRPVDGDRDDGHVLLHRDHRRAGLRRARPSELLARALDEQADDAPVARRLPHLPHGVAVGLAAADRDRAVPADEPAEPREAERPRPSRRSSTLRGESAPTIGMSIQCMWLIA